MGHQHFPGADHGKIGRNQIFFGIYDFHGFWELLTVPLKPNFACLKKKHLPLVIVGDVYLVRANFLKWCKIVKPILHLLKLTFDYWILIFQYLGDWKILGVKKDLVAK